MKIAAVLCFTVSGDFLPAPILLPRPRRTCPHGSRRKLAHGLQLAGDLDAGRLRLHRGLHHLLQGL